MWLQVESGIADSVNEYEKCCSTSNWKIKRKIYQAGYDEGSERYGVSDEEMISMTGVLILLAWI